MTTRASLLTMAPLFETLSAAHALPSITLRHGGAVETHRVTDRVTPSAVCLWCTCGWFATIDAPDRDAMARVVAQAHVDGVRERDAADRARWARRAGWQEE